MSNLYGYQFRRGQRHADEYAEDKLLDMLKSDDFDDIYEAMGAIEKRKLKNTLERLKYIALYNDDLDLQNVAIRTIKKIGGRKALDILRFLRDTEHLECLKYIVLYDEDLGRQEGAIRVLRQIGGKQALDILRFLKSTEYKELIDVIIKHGADFDYYI